MSARNQSGLDDLTDELADLGAAPVARTVDAADREATFALVAATLDAFGTLDGIVANAQTSANPTGVEHISEADLDATFAAGAKGTLPGPKLEDDFRDRMLGIDPALADYSYGPESYDALMLIALAAYAANSTEGADIAEYLRQVSGGSGDGETVTNFADAAALLAEGQQVDFDGASGPITLDENGDPTEATIGIYEYGDDNTYTRIN